MSIDKSSFDLFSKKIPENKYNDTKTPEVQNSYVAQAPSVTEKTVEIPVVKNIIEERPAVPKVKNKIITKKIEIRTNKYESFLPVTLRLKEENFMDLKHIENSIMRSRAKTTNEDRERITSNSILRCLVTSFIDRADLFDFEDIDNEVILNQRIQKLFKAIPSNLNQ
jgi:hypothetical protein